MEKVELSIRDYLINNIRTIPDFPSTGIQFKDITPLLEDSKALELTSFMLAQPFEGQPIDKVVGLESRGFLFGTNLAQDLHAGFVPVRKPGKLPYNHISEEYELEYGKGEVQIHSDAIQKGENVLIHDDLVATGGTAAAATRLVERLGGKVVGYSFIIELAFLKGTEHLKSVPVHSILVID
ncbi:MAG: adenine phosphoribosyltransferase [Bacteroidota bacterium]